MFELFVPIIAGMLGGIARFIFGWAKQDYGIDINKVIKSVVRATIGGAIFGYAIILPFGLGLWETGLMVFFAALTADVLVHDLEKSIQNR